ncbi:MAG: calcium-binding protein [Planktomarina sp.]
MTINRTIIGSASSNDLLDGTNTTDQVQGLAGNDIINGNAGDDVLFGDYADISELNAVLAGDAGSTMEQFGAMKAWDFSTSKDGHAEMTQVVKTLANTEYSLTLDLAANFAAGSVQSAVNILWNGEVIDTVDLSSGSFDTYTANLNGTGEEGKLTVRTVEPTEFTGPKINTDGPIFSYDQTVTVSGKGVTVQAFAPGQANVYQVLNGTLHLFDAEKGSYTPAGASATVNVNAIGFNAEDNLIYGVASRAGKDSLGNEVNTADLVMLDATGNSFGMGSTPYRSWTGDFDNQGNLWVFDSSMDRVTLIDVDQRDADGNPVTQTFKFPKDLVTDRVYDVAYDAETQSFYGIVRPRSEGEATIMLQIDVSLVRDGGEPIFTSTPVTQTIIDGKVIEGVPAMAYGAAVLDADGNLYVGGNSGDHDMNDATGNQGGIFQIVVDPATGTASMILVAAAPGVGANDGAADPTASGLIDAPVSDQSILIRDVSLTPVVTDGFNDVISGGAGQDIIDGSIGTDELIGDSLGDTLEGGAGDDALYGGAGPNWTDNGIVSIYDDKGNRYDQFGNLLPEDDDMLFGGAGDDNISGSAGHDTLDGGKGDDKLKGGSGFDTIFGAEGDDILSGGANQDVLKGGDGNDTLDGGSGNDDLSGGIGADSLKGGSGNDILSGDTGADDLLGGAGDDKLSGGFGEDILNGGSGNDILEGGVDVDKLDGGSGNDQLFGGDGRDHLKGNSGNDTMFGGDDRDSMNGGSGNDAMYGDDGNDYLNGSKGDDALFGGDGHDRIIMGHGDDVATGGAGADTFIFKSDDAKGGKDLITDFNVKEDSLNFTALDLDAGKADTKAWYENSVTLTDGQATIQLGESTLVLTLEDQIQSEDLFATMMF